MQRWVSNSRPPIKQHFFTMSNTNLPKILNCWDLDLKCNITYFNMCIFFNWFNVCVRIYAPKLFWLNNIWVNDKLQTTQHTVHIVEINLTKNFDRQVTWVNGKLWMHLLNIMICDFNFWLINQMFIWNLKIYTVQEEFWIHFPQCIPQCKHPRI